MGMPEESGHTYVAICVWPDFCGQTCFAKMVMPEEGGQTYVANTRVARLMWPRVSWSDLCGQTCMAVCDLAWVAWHVRIKPRKSLRSVLENVP